MFYLHNGLIKSCKRFSTRPFCGQNNGVLFYSSSAAKLSAHLVLWSLKILLSIAAIRIMFDPVTNSTFKIEFKK